jgi:DeoR/GlpR family transcriptional regulator of sugar metabolism
MMTEEDMRQIRAEYKIEKGKAVNVIELAKRYGVSQLTIRKIAKGAKNG